MTDLNLSKLEKKTFDVSRGLTYTYYVSPAQQPKPTIALFHGWPDTAKLWANLINGYLLPNGYGIVALDCLGYGGTSKPTDIATYAWHRMTADMAEILDSEEIPKVISLGHDWGSAMAQRFYNFYPTRVCGLALINVGYIPPSGQFDLDAVNKVTREAFGHGIYEYWHFFTAEDGAAISNQNLESVYTVAHGDPQTWLENWCTPGGMRKYVSEGRTQPTLPYASVGHKADFMERFSIVGLDAPSCWYKAFRFGIQSEADELVAEDAMKVHVPVFFWGGEQDFVCRPAALQSSIDAGLLPDIKIKTREGGHWALLEKPQEFGQDVLEWLQATYS